MASVRKAASSADIFVEDAVLRWLERRDVKRDELRALLESALLAALASASTAQADHR